MRPIEPVELSAFIDDELDAGRAAEVRAALTTDEALRARYKVLARTDSHLRSVAAGMVLSPRIHWPSARASWSTRGPLRLWHAIPALVISAAWLLRNLSDADSLALAVSVAAFVTLTISVVLLVLHDEEGVPAAARDMT